LLSPSYERVERSPVGHFSPHGGNVGDVRSAFQDAPLTFRFVYARLGYMVEGPSRGALRAEPTRNNIQHGSVSYCDVAYALVRLASDDQRTWERKALFFNYPG